jgi:hypothetical protein
MTPETGDNLMELVQEACLLQRGNKIRTIHKSEILVINSSLLGRRA